MTSISEEVEETLSTLAIAPVSKWSFSPIQAIPRNADALWNLIDTVYYAPIPEGHEVIECLKSSMNAPVLGVEPSRMHSWIDSFLGKSIRLSYKSAKPDLGLPPVDSGDISLVFSIEDDALPCFLHSNVYLPLREPSIRSSKKQADSTALVDEVKFSCFEAVSDDKMDIVDSELAFLESVLLSVRQRKQRIITEILAKIQGDVRPNRKMWMEKEEAVLSLFDKKPPSSFQPTAAALASAGGQQTPVAGAPSLNQLGRVDSELPDSFKDVELCCSVCLEGDTTDENDILICDGCSFATHQACYFVHTIPEDQWFCQLCSSRKSKKKNFNENTICCLCLQSATHPGGGVMKPALFEGAKQPSGWAHMKCATWVPEAAFPPDGVSITVLPHSSREELRCTICKLKGGCPLQCAFGKCTVAFHVACAASVGLLPGEKSLSNLFCQRHVKIQLKTSPTISRLLSLRKQDGYLKVMNDKLVCPKIGNLPRKIDFKKDANQAFLLKFIAQHYKISLQQKFTTASVEDLFEPCCAVVSVVEPNNNFNQSVFVDLNCCCECMRVFRPQDPRLHCTKCHLLVDPLCYEGVPFPNVDDLALWSKTMHWSSPAQSVDFVCRRCEEASLSVAATFCMLCMQIGGVLRPVAVDEDDEDYPKGWVHPRCLWWLLPSNSISLTVAPVLQLKAISSAYHFHPCAVCGSRLGCTLRCSRQGCTRRFHVSCGFHAGCYFSVRSSTERMVLAGLRDGEDEEEVVKLYAAANDANSFRRLTTCWVHEQKGQQRNRGALGNETRPQLVRWVPDGVKSELVNLVNQVMFGELNLAAAPSSKPIGRPLGRPKKIKDEEAEPNPKRKRDRFSTVRFIDGQEVLCEDEEWEGGCSLCGKAWLASGELESICCDKCDQWYHFACVGIAKPPSGSFACPKCS